MTILKAIIAFLGGVFSGMYGGQKNKSVRRYGLPAFATGFAMSIRFRWKYLAFLLLIPALSMGYGGNSVLSQFLGGSDMLTRLVYAVILAIPFVIFWWWRTVLSVVLLIIAFQIHAGSLGNASWFGDFLIEDIIRYSTLMGLVIFCVLTDKD